MLPYEFLSPPPLGFGGVELRLMSLIQPDEKKGLVASYLFAIHETRYSSRVGHLHFRIQSTERILNVAGHIGYFIEESWRGKGFSYEATKAVLPLARLLGFSELILTCRPENTASRKIIHRLKARYLDTVPVSPGELSSDRDEKFKMRFSLPLISS